MDHAPRFKAMVDVGEEHFFLGSASASSKKEAKRLVASIAVTGTRYSMHPPPPSRWTSWRMEEEDDYEDDDDDNDNEWVMEEDEDDQPVDLSIHEEPMPNEPMPDEPIPDEPLKEEWEDELPSPPSAPVISSSW